MLGLYLDSLIISHKLCSRLIEYTKYINIARGIAKFYVNNDFLDKNVRTQQQNKANMKSLPEPRMHRSIAGLYDNPYNLYSLTIDYSKNFTTNKVLLIRHMPMFVVKFIVI